MERLSLWSWWQVARMEGVRCKGVGWGGERLFAEVVWMGVVCVRRWRRIRLRSSPGRRRMGNGIGMAGDEMVV